MSFLSCSLCLRPPPILSVCVYVCLWSGELTGASRDDILIFEQLFELDSHQGISRFIFQAALFKHFDEFMTTGSHQFLFCHGVSSMCHYSYSMCHYSVENNDFHWQRKIVTSCIFQCGGPILFWKHTRYWRCIHAYMLPQY